jgi:hypothetical protein
LALASSVVLGIFRQITLRTRFSDRVDNGRTFHGFQPLELFLQALGPAHGQRNGRHVVSQTKVENAPDGAFSVKVGILARAGSRVKAKTGERRGRPKQNPGSGRNRGNQGHIVVKVHGNCKPPEKPLFSPHFAAVTR